MVPFAGYQMPVQYQGQGIIKEHNQCRNSVGLFDVSHMGQVNMYGKDVADFLEKLTVADVKALKPGKASLSLLMNERGGIMDDCIITKIADNHYFVVFNAGCKEKDLEHVHSHLNSKDWKGKDISIEYSEENSLIAVQGPKAQSLMEDILGESLAKQDFMTAFRTKLPGENCEIQVSRCGYTGEDGFEISVPGPNVEAFCTKLMTPKSQDGSSIAGWVGLGARDTLRLEAGLCLYSHELDEDTSPIEAMLAWTISKRRKEEGGFLGYETVKAHMDNGVRKKRCGFIMEGPPARENITIFLKTGEKVGMVTSGAPSVTLKKSIGMAYVNVPFNKFNTELVVNLRGKEHIIKTRKMPFVPSNYFKKD